jgi:hypothetical protein
MRLEVDAEAVTALEIDTESLRLNTDGNCRGMNPLF